MQEKLIFAVMVENEERLWKGIFYECLKDWMQ